MCFKFTTQKNDVKTRYLRKLALVFAYYRYYYNLQLYVVAAYFVDFNYFVFMNS